ncbi:unnamed protein product [Colias eurytheme]|nr:unnamed protein product [Colias eurytheme]
MLVIAEDEEDIPLDSDTDPDPIIGEEAPTSADAECMFCQQLFSENTSGELWVRCLSFGHIMIVLGQNLIHGYATFASKTINFLKLPNFFDLYVDINII